MISPTDRVARILVMVPYVQQHPGIHVNHLAAYLDCDPETILADLDAVLLCGVPPYLPNDYIGVALENDRIYLSFADYFKRPITLTLEEALALSLALRQLPLTRHGMEAAQRLRRKIVELLPRGTRKLWKEARRQLHVGPPPDALQERIAMLRQAVEERHAVHIEYYTASRDEMTRREINPYGLIEHHGEWYVIGACGLRDQERPFRIDRIRAIRLLDRTFTPPESFDIERYRRPQMYFPTKRDLRVQVRIAPVLARWVSEELPGSKTRPLPDGGAVLHLSVSQPQWVLFWVLAHSPHAELLAPEALRRKIVDVCRRTLARYR